MKQIKPHWAVEIHTSFASHHWIFYFIAFPRFNPYQFYSLFNQLKYHGNLWNYLWIGENELTFNKFINRSRYFSNANFHVSSIAATLPTKNWITFTHFYVIIAYPIFKVIHARDKKKSRLVFCIYVLLQLNTFICDIYLLKNPTEEQ